MVITAEKESVRILDRVPAFARASRVQGKLVGPEGSYGGWGGCPAQDGCFAVVMGDGGCKNQWKEHHGWTDVGGNEAWDRRV